MKRRLVLAGLWAAFATAAARAEQHFLIQASTDRGIEEVGRLVLRPDGSGRLSVSAGGDEARRLRKAWADVSRRAALATKVHAADGTLVGRRVRRGSAAYPDAVVDVMSREFGYFLSEVPAKP